MRNIFVLVFLTALTANMFALTGVKISTQCKQGADTFVTNSLFPIDDPYYNSGFSPDYNYGGDTKFLVRYLSGIRAHIGFLRFDISGVVGDMSEAALVLPAYPHGTIGTSNLTVYGLLEDYEMWNEDTITYNNAPGLLPAQAGEYVLDTEKLVRLGDMLCSSNITNISDSNLLDLSSFIEKDTNKLISLLIVIESSGPEEFYFFSKEGGSGPCLLFPNVTQEPTVARMTYVDDFNYLSGINVKDLPTWEKVRITREIELNSYIVSQKFKEECLLCTIGVYDIDDYSLHAVKKEQLYQNQGEGFSASVNLSSNCNCVEKTGIAFGIQDRDNFYFVDLATNTSQGDCLRFHKYVNGVDYKIIQNNNLSIDWQHTFCLTVDYDPRNMEFFSCLRDLTTGNIVSIIANIIDTTYTTGQFGISTNGSGHTFVDNFSVSTFIPILSVSVDIKPTSCPNPLNVKNNADLPVAILGTEEFDVSSIDPVSVRLNDVEPIRSSLGDVTTPLTAPNECECTTNGPDGYPDLTLKFDTQQIVETLGEVNTDDVITLSLTGVLYDETPIEGADCIMIVGRHKPINEADINGDGVVNALDLAILAENWLESSIVE